MSIYSTADRDHHDIQLGRIFPAALKPLPDADAVSTERKMGAEHRERLDAWGMRGVMWREAEVCDGRESCVA
jgi:hypothetical protein